MDSKLQISYTAYIKNRTRGGIRYYCRVRELGRKVYDIPLDTADKSVAEKWCELRRREVDTYNKYVDLGETVPDSVASKIIRADNKAVKTTERVTIRKAIDSFLCDCHSRGLRPTTQEDYSKTLGIILGDHDSLMPRFTTSLVSDIQRKYMCKADQTRRAYNNVLRQFVQWWQRKNKQYDQEVVDAIHRVKCDRKAHDVWSMDEMRLIADAALDFPTRIYFHTLRVTAARNQEVYLAKWGDLKGNILSLRAENTKGRKSRPVPIAPDVLAMLEMYRGDAKDEDLIFREIPTTNTARNTALKRACDRAGIPRGTLHKFRHSAATYYFRRGVDIKTVSQLLGHASETTTMAIYLEATSETELASKILGAL